MLVPGHYSERLIALPFVGIGLIISSVLGVLCSGNEWLTVACLIGVTVISSVLSFGTGLGSPGPVMFVLVAAVSSQLTAPIRSAGLSMSTYNIPMLVAAGATLAYVTVLLLSALPVFRNISVVEDNVPLTFRIKLDAEMTMTTIRVIAGVVIAVLVSKQLGIHRSYWVIVATAAILQAGQNRRLTTIRSIQRVVGTLSGAAFFELIHLFHPIGIWVLIIIMILQFATQVVIARNYAFGLFFVTPLALVNSTIGQMNAVITVRERIIDTLLGAGIALVVFWLEALHRRVAAIADFGNQEVNVEKKSAQDE
ncbi:MAG: FUSC family protein [Chitinophagaceae bacterium]